MKLLDRFERSSNRKRSTKEKFNVVPGLVTILVGENPASVSYVTAKQKTSKELGFYSIQDNQPATIQEEELLKLIDNITRIPRSMASWSSFPAQAHQ